MSEQSGASVQSEMTAAVWTAPDVVETRRVAMPVVPEGWALVRMAYNGICGTDLAILHGKHPRAQAPLIMGHEMSGWVETAGASGPAAGVLVVVEPLLSPPTSSRPCTPARSPRSPAWDGPCAPGAPRSWPTSTPTASPTAAPRPST